MSRPLASARAMPGRARGAAADFAAATPALALLALGFAATLLAPPWSHEPFSDLYVYEHDATALLRGELPYRDVFLEYPPLAAPLLALPGLVGTDHDTYRLAFAALALLLGAAVVLLTGALARSTGGRPGRSMLAVALLPLLLGTVVRSRLDLAPVALLLGALVLVCRGRPAAGMAVLGLGAMTKGFPLAAAPVPIAWLWAGAGRATALRGAATLALVVAVVSAAALALSSAGATEAVRYQLERPVQVESAPATLVHVLAATGAPGPTPAPGSRSDGLEHPAAAAVAAGLGVALLAVLALLAAAAARAPDDARALVLAALATVAAFAAFGKVLSPQFLIWVAPLGALALGWRMHALAAAVAVATLLTLVEFPDRYGDVVAQRPAALALVAARNALLLAVPALALRALSARAGRAAARSSAPAHRAPPRRARRSATDPLPRSRSGPA